MAQCQFCEWNGPANKKLKHQWEAHKDEMEQLRQKAIGVAAAKKKPQTGTEKGTEKAASKLKAQTGTEKGESKLKVTFVSRTIELPAKLLILYDIARQRFPGQEFTESEWIEEVITRFYAEHAEDLGLGEMVNEMLEVTHVPG